MKEEAVAAVGELIVGDFSSVKTQSPSDASAQLEPLLFEPARSNLLVEWNQSTGHLTVGYKTGEKWYQVIFSKKSINNTFSILGFGVANAYGEDGTLIPIENAKFKLKGNSVTDWLSPVMVEAISNGGADPIIYTSGSHGTDGASGGHPTANSVLVQVYLDNMPFNLVRDFRMVSKTVKILTVNHVRAYNTVSSNRSVLEEYFTIEINGSGIHISKRGLALEPIKMLADNGCQMNMSGLTPTPLNTYLMFGANQSKRRQMNSDAFNSGPLLSHPKVYGISIRHVSGTEFASWIDPNFGVGNYSYVPDKLFALRFRGKGKVYYRLFHISAPLTLQTGQHYSWRGGYYWGESTRTRAFDTILQVQEGVLCVKPNGSYIVA